MVIILEKFIKFFLPNFKSKHDMIRELLEPYKMQVEEIEQQCRMIGGYDVPLFVVYEQIVMALKDGTIQEKNSELKYGLCDFITDEYEKMIIKNDCRTEYIFKV